MKAIKYIILIVLFLSPAFAKKSKKDPSVNHKTNPIASASKTPNNKQPKSVKPIASSKTKKSKSHKTKSKASSKTKTSVNKKAPASIYYDRAKEEFLGADYYQPIDSKLVRDPVMKQLQNIENLCRSQTSLQEKIDLLESSLQKIRAVANQYFEEPKLKTEDQLWIGGINSNISRQSISLNQPITQNVLMQINIKRHFLLSYYNHYRLPDDTSVENLPHQWAQMIYKGLSCIQ